MIQTEQYNVSADFIRVVSCIAIVLYHMTGTVLFPLSMQRADLNAGIVFVHLFFILSGYMLTERYGENSTVIQFYRSRIRAIFPMFYLVFFQGYIIRVLRAGRFLYNGRWEWILSLLGMDGYFHYLFPAYYICGEWFLGGLLMLYACFPLLARVIKNRFLCPGTWIVLLCGFVQISLNNTFVIAPNRNLIVCLFFFYSGMCMARFRLVERNAILIAGLSGSVLLLAGAFANVTNSYYLSGGFLALFAFPVMWKIGSLLDLSVVAENRIGRTIRNALRHFAGLSYAVFLVHHIIIDMAAASFAAVQGNRAPIVFVFVWVVILLAACVLKIVAKSVLEINNPVADTG